MSLASNAIGVLKQAERLGSAAAKSFKPSTWKTAAQAAEASQVAAATPSIASQISGGVFSGIGTIVAAPFKAAFAVGSWLVAAPVSVLVLKPIKAVLGGVASVYEKSPRVASVLTGGAAVVGAGSWLSRRNSANLQQNFAQAQENMAMQAMAAQSPQPSYMNSVSADESALLAQRQQAAASHVDAAAARAAQQPAATGAAL